MKRRERKAKGGRGKERGGKGKRSSEDEEDVGGSGGMDGGSLDLAKVESESIKKETKKENSRIHLHRACRASGLGVDLWKRSFTFSSFS